MSLLKHDLYINKETVRVWVCTADQIYLGDAHRLPHQRFLDLVNDNWGSKLIDTVPTLFLPLTDVICHSLLDSYQQHTHFLALNKASILFLGETEGYPSSQHRDGFQLIPKRAVPIQLLVAGGYLINGQLHCGVRERPLDLLNSNYPFIPITSAHVSPLPTEAEVMQNINLGFIAVNKEHIIWLAEA